MKTNTDFKPPLPPAHLSAEAKDRWDTINSGWVLDASALMILESTLESFDRMRQAQKQLKKEGLTIVVRGQLRQHPSVLTEASAKMMMLRGLKALNLNLEALNPGPGRPPGRK